MKRITAIAIALLLGGCDAPSSGGSDVSDNVAVENRGANKDDWWTHLPREEWQQYEKLAVSDGWFDVFQISDDVIAIHEPGQFEEVISYLIIGEQRALLFDTGLGIGDIEAVVRQLNTLPLTVINSHTHYDHIGGNYQFDNILGVDSDFTRRHERGNAHDAVAEFVSDGWIGRPLPADFKRDEYVTRPFAISSRLADGDLIDLGGTVLEVLLTPGHAPDALCLLDRENRRLFTGDTFYPAPLYAHLEGSDVDQYEHSAKRLAGLSADIDVLLPAHNVPIVPAAYLNEMHNAFKKIRLGAARYVMTDGNREYSFGTFSIIVPDVSASPAPKH